MDGKMERRQRIAKAVLTQLEQEGCTVAEAQLIASSLIFIVGHLVDHQAQELQLVIGQVLFGVRSIPSGDADDVSRRLFIYGRIRRNSEQMISSYLKIIGQCF